MMLRAMVIALCLALSPAAALADAKAPVGIAGFELGAPIDSYKGKAELAESDKEFFRPYLGVVPIKPLPGFRSGYLSYGLCKAPNEVLRIKLNYADSSLAFYEKLLAALKKKYGDPAEWRGNAFGTLRTWKWSLKSEKGDDISLILMYYQGDDGAYTQGNSIRIGDWTRIAAEEACYKEKGGTEKSAPEDAAGAVKDFDWYLPN